VSELLSSVTPVARRVALRDIYLATCDGLRPKFGAFAIFDHCMPVRRQPRVR
jgi:hypothetical protein